MQSHYRTQTGQLQGGSHSGQGGGHGHHGPTGLHQKSPNFTTGHQHLQSTTQGPHLSAQKTNSLPFLKTLNKQEAYPLKKYKQLYPTSAVPPKFYGLPKIHKAGTPLRPIVSSRGVNHIWGCQGALPYHQTPL